MPKLCPAPRTAQKRSEFCVADTVAALPLARTIWADDLGRDQVVGCEAVLSLQCAVAAAQEGSGEGDAFAESRHLQPGILVTAALLAARCLSRRRGDLPAIFSPCA
jgi:hypothetical protein